MTGDQVIVLAGGALIIVSTIIFMVLAGRAHRRMLEADREFITGFYDDMGKFLVADHERRKRT